MRAHEIDYQIYGEEMQYVEIELDPQEGVIAEAGTFMMMEDGIRMETIFGERFRLPRNLCLHSLFWFVAFFEKFI